MIPNQGKLILTQQTQFDLNTFHNRADVRNINRLAIDLQNLLYDLRDSSNSATEGAKNWSA